MSNRQIDELIQELKKRMNKEFENDELSFLLSNDVLTKIINKSFRLESDKIVDDLREKIVTDFYAYYLYKLELGDKIEDDINIILSDLKNIDSDEELINYVKTNVDKFSTIIKGYFEYHDKDIEYQCNVFANVVNKGKGFEITNLYKDFFLVDLNYENLLLSNNVIVGLDLLDKINQCGNDEEIIKCFNSEFENVIDRELFLNYVLSNVYADLLLEGNCLEFENLIKLAESVNSERNNFYIDDKNVVLLLKKYNELYKNVKWYEFKDIRDSLSINYMDVIYSLDGSYVFPDDYLKNSNNIFTINNNIQTFLIYSIENLIDLGKTDDEIILWLVKLLDGDIQLNFNSRDIFKMGDEKLICDLIKLFMVSSYYEYCNYKFDDLTSEELSLFNYIDNDIKSDDALELYGDQEDKQLIVEEFYEYYFQNEKTELLARKKIVEFKKFGKLLKINPFMYLEYRRIFGALFPLETSKSTEYGNIIMEVLFDIISLSDNNFDEYVIRYADLAQMFKERQYEICMDLKEINGFILSNIYENLIKKTDSNLKSEGYIRRDPSYGLTEEQINDFSSMRLIQECILLYEA